jgi:hypothetical protein
MMPERENTADTRATYVAPCVVKIRDLRQGSGFCTRSGSGDDCCSNMGNTAVIGCFSGNAAGGPCSPSGSAPGSPDEIE